MSISALLSSVGRQHLDFQEPAKAWKRPFMMTAVIISYFGGTFLPQTACIHVWALIEFYTILTYKPLPTILFSADFDVKCLVPIGDKYSFSNCTKFIMLQHLSRIEFSLFKTYLWFMYQNVLLHKGRKIKIPSLCSHQVSWFSLRLFFFLI